MKSLLEVCLLALVVTAGITPSRATDSPANLTDQASFSGTWHGTMNNLPSIHLTIQEVGTNISGDVAFYIQKRDDDNRPWQLAGESDRALLVPHVEGKTLTFEVEHDRCHGCPEPGPRVTFRMVLTGPNEARLWNLTDGSDSDSGMKLVRQTEDIGSSAPAFEQGISVELPVTRNARSLPEADRSDSLIVSVSADGSSYLGTDPVTPASLPEKLRTAVLGHPERKLYVKADARTCYVHVRKILDGINAAGVRAPALLTAQPEPLKPGTRVPPKGLEVLVGPPVVARSKLAVIQLSYSGQGSPVLKINDQNIPMSSLESRVGQILEHQPEKLVAVRADGQMPFARVVDVADRCQSDGIKVILGSGARAGKASATNPSAIIRGVGAFRR